MGCSCLSLYRMLSFPPFRGVESAGCEHERLHVVSVIFEASRLLGTLPNLRREMVVGENRAIAESSFLEEAQAPANSSSRLHIFAGIFFFPTKQVGKNSCSSPMLRNATSNRMFLKEERRPVRQVQRRLPTIPHRSRTEHCW